MVRDVIDQYYKLVNAGEWDRWLELFDENIVMDEQLSGHLEGLHTLRGIVGGLNRVYSRFQNQPRYIVIEGKQAFVASHISAVSTNGEPIEAEVANYFLIEEEKIVYLSNFHDSRPFTPIFRQMLG